jgi:hypothetical protein
MRLRRCHAVKNRHRLHAGYSPAVPPMPPPLPSRRGLHPSPVTRHPSPVTRHPSRPRPRPRPRLPWHPPDTATLPASCPGIPRLLLLPGTLAMRGHGHRHGHGKGERLTPLPSALLALRSFPASNRRCFLLGYSMRQKSHDHRPRANRAESAGSTSYALVSLSRANDHLSPRWRCIALRWRIVREDGHNWTDGKLCQLISVGEVVAGKIDRKPSGFVCCPDRFPVPSYGGAYAENGLMRVRPPVTCAACPHELKQLAGIDAVPDSGQVARLVMPPALARPGELADLAEEIAPIVAPPPIAHLCPMPGQRAIGCITSARTGPVERA